MNDINAHYQGNIFNGVKFDPYLIARIFNKVDKDQYDRNYDEIFKKKKGVKK